MLLLVMKDTTAQQTQPPRSAQAVHPGRPAVLGRALIRFSSMDEVT